MEELYRINIRELYRTIRSEGWPFILICTYLFFEYVRPQSIYPWLDFIPWAQGILILTFISLAFDSDKYYGGSIISKLMVLYGLVVLLASFFSAYPEKSLSRLRTFFDWFLIYFLIVRVVNNKKRFFIFLLSFLLYSFKMSQHATISWVMRDFSFARWGVTGAPGWFHNSGEIGIQMCIFVPISIAFICGVRKYISKAWFLFFSLMPVTGVLAIIASSSRGALLGLFCSGAWASLRKPKSFVTGTIFLIFSFVILWHLTPIEFQKRFDQIGQDRTSQVRIERWRQGIDAMKKHPLLGVGFGIWDLYCPAHYNSKFHGTYLVHNIFIQCGSELGYLGLIVLVSLIIASFFTTRKVRKLVIAQEDRFIFFISYGFDAAMIGFLVSSFFVTVLYYPYLWIQLALTTSMYSSAMRKHLSSAVSKRSEKKALVRKLSK